MAWPTRIAVVFVFGSSASLAHAGSPLWVEAADAFGEQPCGGDGCYTHYARVADIDGDGDLDVVFPNDGGAAQPLEVYANDGAGGFTDVSAGAVGGHTGRIRQVAIGDIDNDGDLDIYAPEATATLGALFVNDGSGTFVDEAAARLPDEALETGSTRFGDLDDDGDLDIVACDHGSGGAALVYLNDGEGTFAELADAIPFDVGGDINDLDLLDVDRDFDLDLLTNAHAGSDRIWINDGTAHFEDSDFDSSGGLHYGPGVCDIEGDGDLDIWIDNQGPTYTERLWANEGDGTFVDVTVAQVSGNPSNDDNGIICADVDSDGDFDAVVIALGNPERLLVNDGAGNFAHQSGAFSGPGDSSLGAEMGDLDGDHRIDIVTGEGESGSYLNRVFMATAAVPQDETAPRIIVVGDPPAEGEVRVIHYAVSDDALSDHGPRLASAYANVDPDGVAQIVPAFFMGGDVFRVELPVDGFSGEVTFRLCAEDPHGNSSCSEDLVYQVGEVGETTGSTGDSSTGDSSSEDDTSGSSSESSVTDTTTTQSGPGSNTNPSGGSSSVADDSGTSDGGASGGDDGCGCDVDGDRSRAWLGLVALVLVQRRRRRASART